MTARQSAIHRGRGAGNGARSIFMAAMGALLLVLSGNPAGAQTSYRFSPVNQYGINLTAAYWNPIIAHVSERSGVKLALKIGRTSADTTAYVLAEEVEFIFSNHMFNPEREKLGWRFLARRDTQPIRGQIIVNSDSPYQKLEELAGRSISFAGKEALIGYKIPYAALLARNVPVEVVFAGNQDAALSQLFNRRVDASAGNAQLLQGYARREGRNYRVLWSSDQVHDLALMASAKVPMADALAVQRAFIGMSGDAAGRAVLAQVSALVELPSTTAFVRSDGSEYVTERHFFQTAPAALR